MPTAKELGLRVGDRVTVTCNPTIEFTQYTRYKPFAQVERTIESDDEDLADLSRTVRKLCLRNFKTELDLAAKYEGMNARDIAADIEKRLTDGVKNSGTQVKTSKRSKVRDRDEEVTGIRAAND